MIINRHQLLSSLIFSLVILTAVAGHQPVLAGQLTDCGESFVDTGIRLQPGERSGILRDLQHREYILADISITKELNARPDQTIAAFVEQSPVKLFVGKGGLDRYGRMPAHVFSGNGQWLQKVLVAAGLALVKPVGSDNGCLKGLFQAERHARSDKIGIWKTAGSIIMGSHDDELVKKTGSYSIVEGIVLSVGEAGSRVYLNFGKNWQNDFTVIVAKRRAKRFKSAIGRLNNIAGRKIRVRGWMVEDRGPMIEVYYPGQIELDVD